MRHRISVRIPSVIMTHYDSRGWHADESVWLIKQTSIIEFHVMIFLTIKNLKIVYIV